MRKISFLLILVSFVACNSHKEAKVQAMATKDSSMVENLNYPPVDNSIKFEIADANITASMLEVYKAWEDNKMDQMKPHFADSVTVVAGDGTMTHGARDSVVAQMQAYRNSFASVRPVYHSFVSLKTTDRNDTWFIMWYKEYQTDKNGKTEPSELQENWKLNQDGKIVALYQYMQLQPAKVKK